MPALAPLLIANDFFVAFARKNHKNFSSQKVFQKSKGCLNSAIVSVCVRGASGWWPRTLRLAPSLLAHCKLQNGTVILQFIDKKKKKHSSSPKFFIFSETNKMLSPAGLKDGLKASRGASWERKWGSFTGISLTRCSARCTGSAPSCS